MYLVPLLKLFDATVIRVGAGNHVPTNIPTN